MSLTRERLLADIDFALTEGMDPIALADWLAPRVIYRDLLEQIDGPPFSETNGALLGTYRLRASGAQ